MRSKTPLLFLLLMLLFAPLANSQNSYTISGYVKDSLSAETLIGANLYAEEAGKGASTNEYGFFSLTLPEGEYAIRLSYLGYNTKTLQVQLNQNLERNFDLLAQNVQLEEVVVKSKKENSNVEGVDMSVTRLKIEQLKSLPSFFGEVDVFKSLQLLPGVESAESGTSGLFVRGGSADQTLVLLDEATVYNPSHILGFFSVFNADAIKDVQLYKGGIPAKYGGRLSSVVGITMKEGNAKKLSASIGLGNVAGKVTIEGPIVKDKASFIVSGRRTFLDLFLKLSDDEETRQNQLYFYDLNAKANWRVNKKNTLYLSGYFGRDVLGVGDDFGIDWGNSTLSFRWNHLFNQKLFLNTTVLYSKFGYGFEVKEPKQGFNWDSELSQLSAKFDFSFFPNPDHEIEFGAEVRGYEFSPTTITPTGDSSIFKPINLEAKYALEGALYISNRHALTPKLSLDYGLRFGVFANVGPGRSFVYQAGQPISNETLTDTINYDNFDNIKTYHGFEPRIGLRYLLNKEHSIKAFYNRIYQYIQIVSPSTATTPFDRWVPADQYLKPQIGDQVAVGYFRNFKDNQYEFSMELYYKWMRQQVDLQDGADIFLNENIETELLEGKGWAYGAEWLVRKNTGRLTGWLSYSYSKVQRQIEGINGGKAYSPRYDRPHNLSIVGIYQLKKALKVSGSWRYYTGSAVTYPSGIYTLEDTRIPYYDPNRRNADRMPDFHQLDVSVTLDGPVFNRKKKLANPNRKFKVSRTLTLYNLYARKNAFSVQFRDVINGDPTISLTDPGVEVISREPKAVKTSLFSLIPMLSISIKY